MVYNVLYNSVLFQTYNLSLSFLHRLYLTSTSPAVSLKPILALAQKTTNGIGTGGLWVAVVIAQRALVYICNSENI